MEKPCKSCGITISGAAQKKFCSACRKRRYRASTTYLNPGQRVPDGEPHRYASSHGYIRLRWHVAPYRYVETYEHRVIDGRVVSEQEVHHLNRDRSDNRRENLVPLSTEEHHLAHAPLTWHAEAMRLYAEGLSTYQVGKLVSRDPSNVYRALVKLGVAMRSEARIAIPHREANG